MTYEILTLGGQTFSIPPLPWRAVRKIQPAMFEFYAAAGGTDVHPADFARLGEKQYDALGAAVWEAVSRAPEAAGMTRECFDDLPISVREMVGAIPAVARAAGLVTREAGPLSEGDAEAGK